jgi:catechol 2,3-dioxygenase-like lactoylglutathione lyase family enzyme
MTNIDCADPEKLAAFYAELLGWNVTYSDANYGMIEGEGVKIGFGRIDDYQPPAWPDASAAKRFHLDLQVEALGAAMSACKELGATVPEFQPGGDTWHVLLDPGGQPFCLCPRKA